MLSKTAIVLGLLLLAALIVYMTAFFFPLGQTVLNGFHLVLLGLMLLGWVGVWKGRGAWVGWAVGVQLLLTAGLYIIYRSS